MERLAEVGIVGAGPAGARSAELLATLAVASLLRRVLADTGLGVALLVRAPASRSRYALVCAILDALVTHEYQPSAFLRRCRARWAEGKRSCRKPRDRRGDLTLSHGTGT